MTNQLVKEYIEKRLNLNFVEVQVYFTGQNLLSIYLYDVQTSAYVTVMIDIPLLKPFSFFALDSVIERLIYRLGKIRYYVN